MHYQRWQKTGSFTLPEAGPRTCDVQGCGKPNKAQGCCDAHYALLKKYGTPEGAPRDPDLAGETWRPVVSCEGYEVSALGRVRNRRGKVMTPYPDDNGYPTVKPRVNGRPKSCRVHRLVAEAFLGECPEGQEVRHLDGDPANNRWAPGSTEEEVRAGEGNLFYGTRSENNLDAVRHGTHGMANVTECPKGHEYTPENTRIYDGRRFCRRCALIATWRRRGQLARFASELESEVA